MLSKQKYGTPIVEFFSDKKTFEQYVSKDAGIGTRDARVVGRVDAILISLSEMSKDPTHLAFGLGIGNASHSALGPNFTGKHFHKFAPFLKSAASCLHPGNRTSRACVGPDYRLPHLPR